MCLWKYDRGNSVLASAFENANIDIFDNRNNSKNMFCQLRQGPLSLKHV